MWLKRNTLRCSGIEPPGCFNTGHAPTVLHRHWPGLNLAGVYLVGCEVDVRDHGVRFRACSKLLNGGYIIKGKDTITGRRVWAYRSMQSARKRYEKLCAEAIAVHNQIVAEMQALRKKATAGDLGAALTLGLDY